MNLIDITGSRFGSWTVIARAENNALGHTRWLGRCDCGTERIIPRTNLTRGKTRSCGCKQAEAVTRHGASSGYRHTPEYSSWHGLKQRCLNPTDRAYSNYGGRGITVCARWRESFEAFLEDMGERPKANLSIDRINNDAGYWCGHCDECSALGRPANCRWATKKQQQNNTRRNKRNEKAAKARHKSSCRA